MKSWRDATRIHVCKHYVPGSWGKNSMDAAGRIGLNIAEVPEGMAILCFTRDRRMIIILYKVPGTPRTILEKQYIDRGRGRFSIPDFVARLASIAAHGRKDVIAYIENIIVDEK